ncbi:PH domain-containing protein [Flavobacterium sp.]|uniref:PH domain-containing protein n=1 Tax=Flavobacterium sp. TaxID=239 RepID=UPI0028BF02DF|nr:PH domain-containing protein [Flavobacterium sp.]
MKTFRSSINYFLVPFLVMIVFGTVASFFVNTNDEKMPLAVTIFLVLISGFILWMLLDTKYQIKDTFLHYSCGPIRGKIDILQIHKIENVKTWYVSSILKPALGSYGLTLTYNKFDDIYISPKHKSEFIGELLKINPNIQIIA